VCSSGWASTPIEIDDDRITGVRLKSGETHVRSVVVVGPRFESRHELLDSLGVKTIEHPLGIGEQVDADPTGSPVSPGCG
jgi:hypothetical protein